MIPIRIAGIGGPVRGVENARQAWMRRDGVLLGVGDGLGEATPLVGYAPDTLELARAALERVVVQEAPGDLAAIAHAVECAGVAHSPSARFALETALLDRVARERGVSVADVIEPSAERAGISRVVLAGSLDRRDLFERAELAVRRGARILKLKASGKILAAECMRITELRCRIGPDVAIRLDLNGVLELAAAERALAAYSAAGVEAVEEPVAGARLLELGEQALPWFADESLADAKLVDALLAARGCAGFVIKPSVQGGVFRSLELARRARRAGKQVIPSHAFEGPVALAAAAEIALAIGADAAGLDAHDALGAFPRARLATLPDVGSPLRVVDRPRVGLGIDWESDPWTPSG